MAKYSFTVKKEKYQLDLSTSDKDFLVRQFEKWVEDATKYAKAKVAKDCKELVNNQIKEEEEITKKNIEKYVTNFESIENNPVEKTAELIKDDQELEVSKTDIKNQNEESGETIKPSDDLDIFYAPNNESDVNASYMSESGVFDSILEDSLSNPKTELSFKSSPTIKKDNAFLNYIGTRKVERKMDYLLLTAYYFTQYEQKPRFTLKQLNAKLMQNIAVILDHSVLQEAIQRDYIECLPDLTGLIGASEYRLTSYGEKVLLDE